MCKLCKEKLNQISVLTSCKKEFENECKRRGSEVEVKQTWEGSIYGTPEYTMYEYDIKLKETVLYNIKTAYESGIAKIKENKKTKYSKKQLVNFGKYLTNLGLTACHHTTNQHFENWKKKYKMNWDYSKD